MKVKGEGEKPLPISLSYININSSCIFIFLEQECRNPTFTFTLHHPLVGRASTRKVGKFFVRPNQSPGVGCEFGRWGRGFFGCRQRRSGDPGEAAVGQLGVRSIHTPIAFLRSAGAVLGPIWKGSQPGTGPSRPSFRQLSNKPITD